MPLRRASGILISLLTIFFSAESFATDPSAKKDSPLPPVVAPPVITVQSQISEDEVFCRGLLISLNSVKEKYELQSNSVTKFQDIIVNCSEKSMTTVWTLSSERYSHPDIIVELVQDQINQLICKSKSFYSAYARGWEFSHTYQLGNDRIAKVKAYCPMLLPSER